MFGFHRKMKRDSRDSVACRFMAPILACMAMFVAGAVRSEPFAAGSIETCPPIPLNSSERTLLLQALQSSGTLGAATDTASARALRRYATALAGLRVKPSRIDSLWAIEPTPRDIAAEFEAARAAGAIDAWLAGLEPPSPEFRRLLVERCRYQATVDAGGWSELPAGATLGARATGPAVEMMRARLKAEGYAVGPAPAAQTLDPDLTAALRAFQRRHDLADDGVLGPATVRALNVSATARLAQIDANLERLRWLPRDLPGERVEVDIGTQQVTLFTAGRATLTMRAIVGDPGHKTPMFASRLTSIVFNPPWNVPASIARNEILPKAARDPGYLRRLHIIQTPQGLRQPPGPWNALGQIKFDLPSPFGVYLHDTSTRSLFARASRTLSHGCIRLEKPKALAVELLAGQGWSAADIDQTIAAGTTRRLELGVSPALFVLYRTVGVGDDGWVTFHQDVYGWDKQLLAALDKFNLTARDL